MFFRRSVRRAIPETPGNPYRLGRHVHHDRRSLKFVAAQAPALKSVVHHHYGAVLDQGNVGACTGNAAAQCVNTAPFHKAGRNLREADALAIYGRATQLDPFPGTYPPTDTGSDGLDVAKACVEKGYITGYDHAFGIDQALAALVLAPVITGVEWYESMFDPDPKTGLVTISGKVAGGHEFLVEGLNVRAQTVTCLNSWGPGWGLNGRFNLAWADWDRLLKSQGDVTVFRP